MFSMRKIHACRARYRRTRFRVWTRTASGVGLTPIRRRKPLIQAVLAYRCPNIAYSSALTMQAAIRLIIAISEIRNQSVIVSFQRFQPEPAFRVASFFSTASIMALGPPLRASSSSVRGNAPNFVRTLRAAALRLHGVTLRRLAKRYNGGKRQGFGLRKHTRPARTRQSDGDGVRAADFQGHKMVQRVLDAVLASDVVAFEDPICAGAVPVAKLSRPRAADRRRIRSYGPPLA